MPNYDYTCTTCLHEWEAEQRITDKPLTLCPKCGRETAKRLISGGNFILRGNWPSRDASAAIRKEGRGR